MAYGWSAKQIARVNARRARRGQKELSPGKVEEGNEADYISEYEKYISKKPKRRFPETDEDETQVAGIGKPDTSRLDKYDKGAFRMKEFETPRLDENKEKTKMFQKRLMGEVSSRSPKSKFRFGGIES